jgi:lipocalin-like protein
MIAELYSKGGTVMKLVSTLAIAAAFVTFSGSAIAQGAALKRQQLIGGWTLAKLDAMVDGKKSDPFGPTPKGYMNFDGSGRFSIQIYRPGVAKFAANNRMKGTDGEYKAVGQNSIAYFGTYKVNEKDGVMEMHVEQSSYPNWDGADQKRFLKLAGDQLTITNPVTPTGGTGVLVWKRAK